MNQDKLLELLKKYEEFPMGEGKQSAIRAHNGLRVVVEDFEKGFMIGEAKYAKRSENFYHMDTGKKIVKLFYSNLEKIFVNNKKV